MTEHATNKNTQHKRVMMDESSPSPLIFHFDYYWTQHNNSKLRSLYIDALGVLFIILFLALVCQIIRLRHNSTHLTRPFSLGNGYVHIENMITYKALVSCGMFWLRGTKVKSNRQHETVRVSAVHVQGLIRIPNLINFTLVIRV